MTNAELKAYKKILVAKEVELVSALRNREGIEIEKSPDALDEVQRAAERELAIRTLDRESSLLRNVRAALIRVENESFGICLHCEEDISVKRLNAVPWAPYCISCQEQYDAHKIEGDESFDDMLVGAA